MLSQKLQDDLMTAYQKVYEEKRGHAAGASDIEKQASQLASDVRYKARGKSKPGASKEELRKLFLSILGSSPAPQAVKSMAKEKLLGEGKVEDYRKAGNLSREAISVGSNTKKGQDIMKQVNKMTKKMNKDEVKEGKMPEGLKKYLEKKQGKKEDKKEVKEGSSYGITRGSGKPSGAMSAFAKEEESDTPKEKLAKKMKTKKVNKMIAKSAKSEKKLAKELMGEMKAPRMQKGAMAYDGPNKERSEAADRVLAKAKKKMKKEEVEQLDELSGKTLDSYIKKAHKDIQRSDKKDYGKGNKIDRTKSILKAVDKRDKKELYGEEAELGEMMRNKLTGLPTLKPEPKKPKETPMTPQQRYKIPEGMDAVGKEDKDIDNDGDHDSTDKYLLKRRKAIGKAIAKKRGKVKEGFSAWRIDLDFNEQVKK